MDKDFDFTTAKPVSQVPALQQLRKAYQESKQDDFMRFFDSDVQQAIQQYDTPQHRIRLNNVIRALYATT
ncbi:Uncharacterised protein [Moraxella caprae]|uniref:Uncharacterized protein n=1 Tax=Moraxella caprae TaxID=90240 RepID=A0A378U553_9GAMM|nr:hypothetical protein [Moraxella caprae]STZ70246.1 Uncharacterised protein [Moraxella caprae]